MTSRNAAVSARTSASVPKIVAEQDDCANAVATQKCGLLPGKHLAVDIDHHEFAPDDKRPPTFPATRRRPSPLHANRPRHLIAPSIPRMKNRCVKKKTINAGATVRTAPTAITRCGAAERARQLEDAHGQRHPARSW